MAQYIDRDIFMQELEADKWGFTDTVKIGVAMDKATADVVPKREYDAVVSAVDNSTNEFLKLHDAYQNAKAEVAREIFELIECAFSPVLVYNGYTVKEYLAELKKKYTEGE